MFVTFSDYTLIPNPSRALCIMTYALIGKVLNLGADWRLTDAQGAIRPDARYNIQTDDGTFIYVMTEGLPPGPDGRTMLRGKFETSTNGTAAWLNDVAAVGVLTRNGTESVLIDMWQVCVCMCENKYMLHTNGI